MTGGQIEVLTIALLAGWACALPGMWLVLRGSAMLVDAISHTILLGIVLAFLLAGDLNSPLLRIGAAVVGVITVVLVELLARRRLIRTDAAIGLVFPVLFALAVLLISLLTGNIHLDTDAVITGEIGLTPFDRIEFVGNSLPRSLLYLAVVLLFNAVLMAVFWKELKITTFDPALAASLGLAPGLVGLGLVTTVSISAVTAFEAVGSILVVALVVGPGASAVLITRRLPHLLMAVLAFSASAALLGYLVAWWIDTTIAGSIATVLGAQFVIAFLFAPRNGLIARARRRRRQTWEFAQTMLVSHLQNHEGTPQEAWENDLAHLQAGLRWEKQFVGEVVERARAGGLITLGESGRLNLQPAGRRRAQIR